MARRRYISTTISTDTAVNKLAMNGGDFAALLYTWMIPHAADDATLSGHPEELLYTVMPGRRDMQPSDIVEALELMVQFDLIEWDGKTVRFPASAFYKHQSYIKDGERRGANNTAEQRNAEDDSANQRKSAHNDASFSLSSSVSSSVSSSSPSTTSTEIGEKSPRKPKTIKTPISDDIVIPDDQWQAMKVEQCVSEGDMHHELVKMVDHFKANGERKVDWVAAWRNWMRSPYRKPIAVANGRASPNGRVKLPDGVTWDQVAEWRTRIMGNWSVTDEQRRIVAMVDQGGVAA